MNDHELDRLVATATHVRDSWVDGFDLRAAEDELLEEIMATTDSDAPDLAGVEPPPSEPAPFASRPGRFKLAVAIGVAAALVVGIVLVRSLGDDGDSDEGRVGTSQHLPIQPMIADPVPEGHEVNLVFPEQGPEPMEGSDEIDTVMFGERTETALNDDVVIFVEPTPPDGEIVGGSPVPVRGQEGTVSGDTGNIELSWTEPSGVHLTVLSHTFDREQVRVIAEGLEVDGTTVELGAMPEGVPMPPKVAELARFGGPGYDVSYMPTDPDLAGPTYQVTTRAVDEDDRVYELWLRGPRTDGQVRGADLGLLDEGGEVLDLAWEPVTGQVVEVLAQGVDEAEARAFAETIRPATDAEWAALQEEVANRSPEDEATMELPPDDAAHRELANGVQLWAWMDGDQLCYLDEYEGGGGGNLCTGEPRDPPLLGVSPSWDEDGPRSTVPAVVGVAPAGTESIDGGQVTFGEDADGGRIFIWESDVEGELPPDDLTFRDADGTEIDTLGVITY